MRLFCLLWQKEASGHNLIPGAYATVISSLTGLKINNKIYQSNETHHTGASAISRIMDRATFDGKVDKK